MWSNTARNYAINQCMFKVNTKYKAKRLRAITFAIAKLEECQLNGKQYWKNEQIDSASKIISHFKYYQYFADSVVAKLLTIFRVGRG